MFAKDARGFREGKEIFFLKSPAPRHKKCFFEKIFKKCVNFRTLLRLLLM